MLFAFYRLQRESASRLLTTMDTQIGAGTRQTCTTCHVATHNSFCEIRTAELADLEKVRFRRSYPARATLFVQGQTCNGAFILCEGHVKLSTAASDGRVVTFGIAGPGDLLGLSAALTGGDHETTAEALEDCHVNFLSTPELIRFLNAHPDACLNAARQLSRDYQEAFKRVCSLASSDTVANKLARLFLNWSGNGHSDLSRIRLENVFTHESLGEMIGVSRETVTRALKQLREGQIATLKGNTLTIYSRPRLRALAGSESEPAKKYVSSL